MNCPAVESKPLTERTHQPMLLHLSFLQVTAEEAPGAGVVGGPLIHPSLSEGVLVGVEAGCGGDSNNEFVNFFSNRECAHILPIELTLGLICSISCLHSVLV